MGEGRDREYKFDVPEWLRNLLNQAAGAERLMKEVERARKDLHASQSKYQGYTETELEMEFKFALRSLYFWYEPKFKSSSEVSVPEDLKDKIDIPQDVHSLSLKESMQLFRSIRDLMEHLGHTRFESEKHSEDGVGM